MNQLYCVSSREKTVMWSSLILIYNKHCNKQQHCKTYVRYEVAIVRYSLKLQMLDYEIAVMRYKVAKVRYKVANVVVVVVVVVALYCHLVTSTSEISHQPAHT